MGADRRVRALPDREDARLAHGRSPDDRVRLDAAGRWFATMQILPAIDFARDTVRARGLPFVFASNWSFPLERLEELPLPSLFQHLKGSDGQPAMRTMYRDRIVPFLSNVYCGAFFVVLGIAGIFAAIRGRWWFLAAFGASVIVAMGDHTPLMKILYDAGLVNAIRYPEKFMLGAALGARDLVGDRCREAVRRRRVDRAKRLDRRGALDRDHGDRSPQRQRQGVFLDDRRARGGGADRLPPHPVAPRDVEHRAADRSGDRRAVARLARRHAAHAARVLRSAGARE